MIEHKSSLSVLTTKPATAASGYVTAPDRDAAEAIAVEQFELTEEQRKRLIVTEYR